MRQNIYLIRWDPLALKKFNNIQDKKLKEYILDTLENIITKDPLVGKLLSGPFKWLRSYRIGVIRILYKPLKNYLLIMIVDIDHRKNVYR